jgi:hypothetical protein
MGYGSAQMPGDRITLVGRERLGQEPRPRGAEVARLAEKGTTCGPVSGQGQGLLTVIALPGPRRSRPYKPLHTMARGTGLP